MTSLPSHDVTLNKLDGYNYSLWFFKIEMLLQKEDLWEVVTENIPDEPKIEWKKKDSKARAIINLSIADSQIVHAKNLLTAKATWDTLKNIYERKTLSGKIYLLRKLYSLKLEEDKDMQQHITTMMELVDKLRTIGETLKDSHITAILLCSLPKSYSNLITMLESRPDDELTLEFTKNKLLDEHTRRVESSKDESTASKALKSLHGASSQRREKEKKFCSFCHKPNHSKEECWHYQKRNNSNKEYKYENFIRGNVPKYTNQSSVTQEQSTNQRTTKGPNPKALNCTQREASVHNWFIDSGATSHMAYDESFFTELNREQTQNVVVANGNKLQVKGIGQGEIKVITPQGKTDTLLLTKVLYIPELTDNLLSVSAATSNGCKVTFNRDWCTIERDNTALANGILDNGMYRLHLDDNPQTRTFKANVAKQNHCKNKNCLMLWHDRLGHRNIESIKKIRNENLARGLCLNNCSHSTDCVQCIQGKLTETPFPKKTEYRATETLQLVHSDICGPLPTNSLSGKRYFITFTDDYSRYTKIYLLKGKDEAYEKIKDYVISAHTEFGKNIQTIRTDNGPTDKTPFELWTNRKPSLKHLKRFGCKAFAYIPKIKRNKLDSKVIEGIFLGYDDRSKGYRILHDTDNITISRSVKFIEKENGFHRASTKTTSPQVPSTDLTSYNYIGNAEESQEPGTQSENLEDSETEDYIQPSTSTGTQVVTQRRSTRPTKGIPPIRNDYMLYKTEAQDIQTPTNYSEVLQLPKIEREKWLQAINEELNSLEKNNVWELTPLPKDKKIIGCKWTYKQKLNSKGEIERYKARLVAKGFNQKFGRDYEETFAPIVKHSTIRAFLAASVYKGMQVIHLDVKTAFLHGDLDKELYMELPEGLHTKQTNKVCKLKKAIYGLKQAGRSWNTKIASTLIKNNFKQSIVDPCLFTKNEENHSIYLILYVDDMLLASDSEIIIQNTVKTLEKEFEIKNLGDPTQFIGIEISRNREGELLLSQKNKIQELVERYNLQEAKPTFTPMESGYPGCVQDYLNKFTSLADRLGEMDAQVPEDFLSILLLCSLPESYEGFRTAIETRDELPSFETLKVKMLEEEIRQTQLNGTTNTEQAFLGNPERKNLPSTSKPKPKGFPFSCHFCGKKGHKAADCRKRKSRNPKNEMVASFGTKYLSKLGANEWCLDSGATTHMCSSRDSFDHFEETAPVKITLANGGFIEALGKGKVKLECSGKNGPVTLSLEDVLFVPELNGNLFSISRCTGKYNIVNFKYRKAEIVNLHTKICIQAYERNGLYILSQINCPKALATREISIVGEKNYEKWHSRFGHLNLQDLKKLKMQNIVYGLPNFDVKNFTCEVCLKGKQTRLPFQKESFTRSREPLELVHTDICGPMRTKSLGGALYFSTFIDDFSGFIFTFIMKSRSEVFKGFRIFKNYAEKQTGKKLKCIRNDNAPEYLSREFKDYLEGEGIGRQLSVEYTPQQNGVAERANRTLVDMTRCFMIEGNLPETLWAELINTATYIRNRCPRNNDCKTPHELFTKRKPVVSHLKIIGSKSFAVNNRPNRSKFAPRSEEYKLIGYFTESKAYRLWKPGTRTIIKSRDVRFIEPELSRIRNEVIEIDVSPQKDPFVKEIPLVEEKGSTSEVKSRTEIESESDLEMSDLVDEPSESEVIISRRGRGRPRYIRIGKPGRPRKEYPTANLSTQELLEAKYLPDPKDAEEALSGRDSYFWKKAMEEEFDSLIENKTWELVDPPKNRNIIGTKWVFKTKCNSDGSVERHKARLVAKGYSQQYGIDYEETFAPVVRQTENFVSRKYPERVCRLKKAIYGLKQAGIVWHERLDNELKYLGLKQIQSDNCVYIKHHEGILLVAIYVDDLIIAAEREDTLKSFKESIKRIFKIKDLGGINCCLGIRIQMKEDGSISIDQERYIEELLAKYRMKEAKPISTPMDSNSKLTKISSIEGENEPVKKVEYQSLIGSLIYLSVSTRPDIAYAVSALGQFSNDPRRQHWNAAKRVLRYLKGTSCLRITYRKSNEALHGYADADWGGNLVDRKSHTGIVYFLARGPIAWESKKQQTVTLSSTESEYIALCEAGKEAVYLRALLDEMGFGELLNGPTVLKTDNQGAQQLARNPVYHARTKHIDIKWHFIRSICSDGLVEVVHTPTQENVADILTKGLPRNKNEEKLSFFAGETLKCKNEELLELFVDSGSTSHITNSKKFLLDEVDCNSKISIAKKEETLIPKSVGKIQEKKCDLKEVMFVPNLTNNLLSVSAITRNKGKVVFEDEKLNGKAERLNRTLMEKTRAILIDSGVEKYMWGEAVRVLAYLLNRSPTQELRKTPAELWFNKRPNLSNLQLFGCEANVKTLKHIKKLEDRNKGCINKEEKIPIVEPEEESEDQLELNEESSLPEVSGDKEDIPTNPSTSKYNLRPRSSLQTPSRYGDFYLERDGTTESALLTYSEAIYDPNQEKLKKAIKNKSLLTKMKFGK
ncbi:hypothetical protein LAZ67_14001823 [Cordylochernes scorpioides]|uniref:Retrovirus-related Pol polyprotein from transposon TNT 1-94 n=1 Tax=Cordylochernes scorpioides TaxID=51811 RepID=A0ABY6LAC2_9ARAC|nr:hypothetical protein LAZ67_14001823 [Cordylochernes scorpioides]